MTQAFNLSQLANGVDSSGKLDLSTNSKNPSWTTDITANGLTVGKGGGAVSTNTAVGASALAATASGTYDTGVGYQSLNALTSGNYNTAIGGQSLQKVTTGANNSAVGVNALQNVVSGSYNSAVGFNALSANTGSYNSALGDSALVANTSGANNTAVGQSALQANTTASNNTAVGYQAGYSNTTGANNTLIGVAAGYSLTTGSGNTFVGPSGSYNSGSVITTGSKNTILGAYSGNLGGLDIRTASNYIVLSDGDGNPRAYYNSNNYWVFTNGGAANNTVANFVNDSASSPYGIYVGLTTASPNNTSNYVFAANDSTGNVYRIWSNGTTSGRSDARLKKNIADATPKLDDICRLQVRNYEWNESIDGHKEIGLIAQEVETVFPNLVITHDVDKDGDDYKEVKYSVFVPMLLKAVQELKTIVDAQAAEIAELKAKVA